MVEIAVIGGGPKAAAIAAKAKILAKHYKPEVHITIFEKSEIGANWTGRHGYTCGTSELCTPAERDLGFPYKSVFSNCDTDLYEQFSWSAYAVAKGRHARWVDNGRRPPEHTEFAKYLQWAVERSSAKVINMDVKALHPLDKKWQISGIDKSKCDVKLSEKFDGVVITGPGEPRRLPVRRGGKQSTKKQHPAVFDGKNFWSKERNVKSILERINKPNRRKDSRIVVIGGGGTGAAIIAWLAQRCPPSVELSLIANQATIHARQDNPFENRIFSDPDAWQFISRNNRKKFYDRLTRGIVWENIIDQIRNSNIVPQDGRATEIVTYDNKVVTKYTRDNVEYDVEGDMVVDATGFDTWWFSKLLVHQEKTLFDQNKPSLFKKEDREQRAESMSQSLEFEPESWPFPSLQLPNLASAVGPGFGTLMTLGSLSDTILARHLDAETTE
jgi:mycobactin lysine-N-oxygenase